MSIRLPSSTRRFPLTDFARLWIPPSHTIQSGPQSPILLCVPRKTGPFCARKSVVTYGLSFDFSEGGPARLRHCRSRSSKLLKQKTRLFIQESGLQVPKAGLEPAYLAAHAPETCVSTNFTTSACTLPSRKVVSSGGRLVPGTGLEPAQLAPYAPQTYVSTNFTTRAGG